LVIPALPIDPEESSTSPKSRPHCDANVGLSFDGLYGLTVKSAAAGAAVAIAPAVTNPATTAPEVTLPSNFLNMVVPPDFSPIRTGNRCQSWIKTEIEERNAS
jgi:hypothetical protein